LTNQPGFALWSVQHQHLQMRREFFELALPIADQTGRHEDHRGLGHAPGFFFSREVGDRLQRLAEAHVVREHAADVALDQVLQPIEALLLIRP